MADERLTHPSSPEDGGPAPAAGAGAAWGRRQFLTRLGAGAAGLVALRRTGWAYAKGGGRTGGGSPPPVGPGPLVPGQIAIPMAMHLHASFSEADASLAAHLNEATLNNIPVIGISDHDWRMSQIGYRKALHFDSLNTEKEGLNQAWTLLAERVGLLTADSTGGIVASPVSPVDPSPLGALHVRATSTSSLPATYRFLADTAPARTNQRANIVGQTWDLEVFPVQISSDAWLELLVTLSYRPAMNGRAADRYQISYRFGVDGPTQVPQGILGVVAVPVTSGRWNSVHLDPLADIKALWPDIVAEDNGTQDFYWGATSSNGAVAEGYFDYHRFNRDPAALAGDAPLQLQQQLLARYQSVFPAVATMQAIEYSYYAYHTSGFGPFQHLPLYPDGDRVNPPNNPGFSRVISDQVQAAGGVSSYNHPFGTSTSKPWAIDQQDATRRKTAVTMLGTRANDANLLEVGYAQRGNLSLAQHLSLFDTMWRNGLWMTATGVTDDHFAHAGTWLKGVNRYVTTVWTASAQVSDLLTALKAGRAFCWDLPFFKGGALDLMVDTVAPMGSISVRPDAASRQLTIVAIGVPAGGSVQVVRGLIDYAGPSYPDPASQVVATIPAADLATGSATVAIDATASCFVRATVFTSAGVVVAFSNPIGLFRETPPTPVPPERVAPNVPPPTTTTTSTTTTSTTSTSTSTTLPTDTTTTTTPPPETTTTTTSPPADSTTTTTPP
ncbi:MAG: hypothetical protein ACR2GF_02335 [Acidimicrobiales bacterium]